jgi:hypothetical protein
MCFNITGSEDACRDSTLGGLPGPKDQRLYGQGFTLSRSFHGWDVVQLVRSLPRRWLESTLSRPIPSPLLNITHTTNIYIYKDTSSFSLHRKGSATSTKCATERARQVKIALFRGVGLRHVPLQHVAGRQVLPAVVFRDAQDPNKQRHKLIAGRHVLLPGLA